MLKYSDKERLNFFIGLCLLLSFIIKLINYSKLNLAGLLDLDSYDYTEFLINFQGGFVRRGLIGELLYQLYSWIPFPLRETISIVCYAAFFYVLIFFFRQFKKHGYCWWLIFSPLFLNMPIFVIRKDFILYVILIGIIYLLRNAEHVKILNFIAFLLLILSLFIHEAFVFWGFPIYVLLILSNCKSRIQNMIYVITPVVIFLILCHFKGSMDVARSIVDSWNGILQDSILSYKNNNSIGALGWNAKETFLMHLKVNLDGINGYCGLGVLPLIAISSYYMFSNFIFVFKREISAHDQESKLTISLLYSLSLLCLIPMFTFLSCDTSRVFQYASVATFSTFLIIPNSTIINIFPKWYCRVISGFNNSINNLLPPSKGLMVILLFIIGVGMCGCGLYSNWNGSIIGTLTGFCIQIVRDLI